MSDVKLPWQELIILENSIHIVLNSVQKFMEKFANYMHKHKHINLFYQGQTI